jgi:hypothetical protein
VRAYCNYQQDNWKQLLPIAEFCYNNTQSETMRLTPFFTNCGYHPCFKPNLSGMDTRTPEISDYISTLTNLHAELWAEIHYAQASQADQANKSRYPDPVLRPGHSIWLRRKHVKMICPTNILDYKLIDPYTILEWIGLKAYKLDLPSSIRIYPVFHISLLELAQPRTEPIPGHIQPPPPPIMIDDEEEWEVEEIVDSRYHRKQLQY